MVAEVAYKMMQCYQFKVDKDLQIDVFHFLGTLVKTYSQGYPFVLRIIQMIKLYDHVASSIASGIQLLVENYNCSSILHNFIKEITEVLSDEKCSEKVILFRVSYLN